jgi:hypothetical protein
MKIIIIANHKGLNSRPDKLDYNFFEYLKQNSKNKIYLFEVEEKNKIIEIIDIQTIIIVFSCMPDYLHEFKNKKIYFIYDLNCKCYYKCNGSNKKCLFINQLNYINQNNFDIIFYKYQTYITEHIIKTDLNPSRYIKFPHMMFENPRDINFTCNEKKYDILFYGSTIPIYYPFRNRLYYLLQKNQDKFNILFLPYNKKKNPENIISGHDLYRLIKQSYLTISTKLLNNILVSKYYEIGLYGSTVLGDYPDLEDEIFLKNNMIYIDNSMTDEEIINIIQYALSDKQKLKEYSNNTIEYISNNYCREQGVQYFDNIITKYI